MAAKTMLFGPIGRQVAIPCPESGMGMDYNLTTETTDLLSGEQAVWRSPLSYRTFNMSWTGSSDGLQPIIDVHSGLYGSGPYYLTDPVAAVQGNNLFPAKWASPFLLEHAVNGWSDPVVSAQAISPEQRQVKFTGNVDDAGEAPISSVVTCVPGSPMYYKAWGSATGAAAMRVYRYSKSAAAWTLPASTLMRTNWVPNPSFETDATGVVTNSITSGRTTFASSIVSGTWALTSTVNAGAGVNTYLYQTVAVTPGQYFAFGVHGRWSSGSQYVKQRLIFRDAANAQVGATAVGPSTQLPSNTTGGQRLVLSALVPALAVSVWCMIYMYEGSAGTAAPTPGSVISSDAWMGASAPTQAAAEAQAQLSEYFDGSTPAANGLTYGWTGTTHGSVSQQIRPSTFVPNTTNDVPVNILTQAEADARDIVAFKFVPYVPDASTLTLQHMDCAINDYRTYTPYQFGLDPSLYPSLTLFPGMALYPMGPDEPHAMFRAGKGVGPVQFTGNIGGSLTSAVIDRIGMSIDIREVARDPNN